VPKLPAYGFKPKGGEPKKLNGAVVWAFPEVTKVDPVSAEILGEEGGADLKRKNAVWDGADSTIRIAAAKGEIISFQVGVEGEISGCGIGVSSLAGTGDAAIPDTGVRLWRNWYVGKHSEYAMPLKGTFDCPMSDNRITGQKFQAVTVDYHIPIQTAPGDYTGTVTVSAGENKAELSLKVKVYDVTIPEEIHFNPELNNYRWVGKDVFRLAHYHRCTPNVVPYSQNGRTKVRWLPRVGPDGQVTDWSPFDNGIGDLFDGSCVKDNPRAGVPVPTFYIPLFEGWPLNYRNFYSPGPGVPVSSRQKLKHDILAKPIEQAMSQKYKDVFIQCTREFAEHTKAKGWTNTLFQMYQNNKFSGGHSMWTLDEPRQYTDWAAINFWADLFKKGISDPEVYTRKWHEDYFALGLKKMNRDRATLLYRGDISRPQWQGSMSDGLMNNLYANSGQFSMFRLMRSHKKRMPAILYCYGSCNPVNRSNWESAAWCLKAYAHHCDGVLPWKSVGNERALQRPDQTALVVVRGGGKPPAASFRVHALRRGAQDCELLRLLQIKKGWSREQIGLLVSQKIPLTSKFKQAKAEDASAVTFNSLTAQGFCELKEGVLKLLTAGAEK
jgi:hypothetical protein